MKAHNNKIGVIIGRFQIDQPHAGHMSLINEVIENHNKVIIFVGTTQTCGTKENPLDYPTRELMLRQKVPEWVVIAPLPDFRSDVAWSKNVDETIKLIFPIDGAILYGSRDSFLTHYQGKNTTFEVDELPNAFSSTEIRQNIGGKVESDRHFREGVIFSTQNRYPIMYHVVDVAVIKGDSFDNMEILMGTKYGDGELRLIGGFSDTHETLELTARREVHEEAGMSLAIHKEVNYVGSYAIDDWRYNKSSDKLVSSFFWIKYAHGYATSCDDLDDIEWYKLSDIWDSMKEIRLRDHYVIDSHRPMIQDLIKIMEEK